MNKLKALIFDVDGTLADTERNGHRVAFNQAFEEAGLPWHWDVETYVSVNYYTRQQSFTGAKIVLDQLGEPGNEFTVPSGDAGESTFVDIPLLKRFFAD